MIKPEFIPAIHRQKMREKWEERIDEELLYSKNFQLELVERFSGFRIYDDETFEILQELVEEYQDNGWKTKINKNKIHIWI